MVVARVMMFVLCLLLAGASLKADVKVDAQTVREDLAENIPVDIVISVTHPLSDVVDIQSFKVDGSPAKVTFDKDVTIGGQLVISTYLYQMKGVAAGLHLLPVFSVKVGGKTYQSIARSFEVKGMETSVPGSVGHSFLRIENIVKGPTTLYPGQKTTVGYRYVFNDNIETTEENLPLFDLKGFIKVGDKVVNKKSAGETSYLEVTQQMQAQDPGEYASGPATLAGYVYKETGGGGKTYIKPELKSTAPSVNFTIKAFPEKGKPASFNGAIGKYTFKDFLETPPIVILGDEITLALQMTGTGDIESLPAPDICCQPGMSGVFRLSDLPPVGKVEGNTKTYIVLIRPLTTSVKQIPSLEFSSFDPDTGTYNVQRSQPISITVKELNYPPVPDVKENAPAPTEEAPWMQKLENPPKIENDQMKPLTQNDLTNRLFGSWWVLLIVPVIVGVVMYQYRLKKHMDRQQVVKTTDSNDLFNQANAESENSSLYFMLLTKAMILKLQEKQGLPASVKTLEALPSTGLAGEVKAWFNKLDEQRYSGQQLDPMQVRFEAQQLFKRLG